MRTAIAVLAFGYWEILVNRARLKLPEADAENVAGEALESAIVSAFDGKSVGEFRSWLHTILARRIADYYKKRERTLPTDTLPGEHEEAWGDEPAIGFEGDALHARQCIARALSELQPAHREVVDLHVLGPLSAGEAAGEIDGMTDENVHQIASRFRKTVQGYLDEGESAE